jgi:hypothetical protein
MKKFLTSFLMVCAMGIGLARAYQTLIVNGVPYLFPDVNDEEWGQRVTDWATAVTNGMLQKAGGTFTLTSEAYFGPTNGLRAVYFKSKGLPAATTGTIRLSSSDSIQWRNTGNTGNNVFAVNGSNLPTFNGYVLGYSTDIATALLVSTTSLQSQIDALNISTTQISARLDTSTTNITSRADDVAASTTVAVNVTGSTQTKAGGFIVGGDLVSSSTIRSNMGTTSTAGERFNFVAYSSSDTAAEFNFKNNATGPFAYEYLASSGIVGNIRFWAPYSGAGNMEYFRMTNLILNRNVGDITSQMNFWGPDINGTVRPIGTIGVFKSHPRWGIRDSNDPSYIPSSMFEVVDGSITIRGGGLISRAGGGIRSEGLSELLATTNIGSATVYGTVTSTTGFVGDGSKLYNVKLLLPLPSGSTTYAVWQDVANATSSIITSVSVTTNSLATRLNNLDTSTANITNRADAVAVATTSASVQKITVYSAGVFAGNVSTINFNTNLSVSVTGGTATVNAAAGGGGSGVSSYQFTIGTSSIRGAGYVGNTQTVFNSAIADAMLAVGTTDEVIIYVQRGSYTFTSPVFVPYNVTILGEDHSAICWMNSAGGGIFDIEGRVTNMGFISKAWTYSGDTNNRVIAMKWRGRFDHNKFHSITGTSNILYYTQVQVRASSFTECNDNEFFDISENYSPIYCLMNTSVSPSDTPAKYNNFLRNKLVYNTNTTSPISGAIVIYYGSYNRMENNEFYLGKKSAAFFILMPYGVVDHMYGNIFKNNYISCDASYQSPINISGTDYYGMGVSTGTEISHNRIDIRVPGNPAIKFTNDNAGLIQNVIVDDNVAVSTNAFNTQFITCDTNSKRNLIKNNSAWGFSTFISDAGGNYYTPYKNNDNSGVNQ